MYQAYFQTGSTPLTRKLLAGFCILFIVANVVFSGVGPARAVDLATVLVEASVVNNNGGTNVANDFIVNVSGAGAVPANFHASAEQAVSVTAGQPYVITANPGSVYTVVLSPDCSSTLVSGDVVTCTIVFDDLSLAGYTSESPNLIANPGLETADGSNASVPQSWYAGAQWGLATPTYEYPIASSSESDISHGLAARVTYISNVAASMSWGDAKWYFAPVAVTEGRQYKFSDAYLADVPTMIAAEFFTASHSHLSYAGFVSVPASPANTWRSATNTFTAPPGAAYMTVFHALQSVGSLTTDSYSLTEAPLAFPFTQGFVSLTFDDGFKDMTTYVQPALADAGLKGTFYNVSHLTGFGIENPGFEEADAASSSLPQAWSKAGSTQATFSYPVTGHTGVGARVVADHAGSGAGWYFPTMTILGDQNFTYGTWYNSTATTNVYIEVTVASGSLAYINAAGDIVDNKVPRATLPSTVGTWQYYHVDSYFPPEAQTATAFLSLSGIGSLTVDDVTMGAYLDFMTPEQVLSLQADGHEMGGHTQTHKALTTIPQVEATTEVAGGRGDFLNGGIAPMQSFAYPYGLYNGAIQSIVHDAGYTSARTVIPGFNGTNADKYALLAQSIDADTTLDQVKAWVNQAVADKTWLILVFHQVQPDVSHLRYGTTPDRLAQILDYLNDIHAPVHTVSEGLALMDVPTPTPTPSPTATPTPSPTPSDTPTPTPTPSDSPTPSPTPSETPTPTPTPSDTPTPTPSPTPSDTPTPTPSDTPTPSPTPSDTPTPTPTPSESPTPSETPTPSPTPSETPTPTPTPSDTPTPTPTSTPTPENSSNGGNTGSTNTYGGGVAFPTPTPSVTPTPTPSVSPSPTPTETPEVLGAAIVVADPANLKRNGLVAGDLISAAAHGDPDVYIVSSDGYKRLFLNPAIFALYGHLGGWNKVKSVTKEVRDAFPTSVLLRNCDDAMGKVYAVQVTGEDTGVLHWVNVPADEIIKEDAHFFQKVFCINTVEFDWYSQSSHSYGMPLDLPVYSRE